MSEPFVQTTTPVIERANRLLGAEAYPGFRDIFQISLDIANSLTANAIDYPGWDTQQMMVLKVRAQAAKEHHELLFARIKEAIRDGVQEQASQINMADKTPGEIIDQGDYVRREVLTHFEEMDNENRAAGSY
jgi:hypothetical protein